VPSSSPSPSPLFLTTRWSVVLAARGDADTESHAALETLCHASWYPLYAYLRRMGQASHDAEDLVQEFFARLLEKEWLLAADREKGRFRTFLLVALKRFMAKEWQRERAQKRGGALTHVPLDTADAERRYAGEPVGSFAADAIYERRWAMTLLDQSLESLAAEYARTGKAAEFTSLKPWLTADRGGIPYAEVAAELSSGEGAVRVAVHRMRKRFREVFRERIAETVSEAEDVPNELLHLARVLGGAM
jgi:RNA polymerase sigma-70 factor (ECF subfamily)